MITQDIHRGEVIIVFDPKGDPPVSRGCSVIEIVTCLGAAVGVFLPLGGIIGWWQGAFQLGLAGGVIAIVLTMAIVPSILQA